MKIRKKQVHTIFSLFDRIHGERQIEVRYCDGSKDIFDLNNCPDKLYDFVMNTTPDQEFWEMSKVDSWKRYKRRAK